MKFTFTNLIFIVVTLVFTPVQAGGLDSSINWIITGDSPTLDRSTTYLLNGNTGKGMTYARKALKRSQSPLKDLIANHNLCLAHTMEGNELEAAPHCQIVSEMEKPRLALKKIKEGLYKVKRRGKITDNEIDFRAMITANLQGLGQEVQVSQMSPAK